MGIQTTPFLFSPKPVPVHGYFPTTTIEKYACASKVEPS